MGKLDNLVILTTLWGLFASGLGDKTETELIASMRELQLPSLDAQDFYASHSPVHVSRFRGPRAVKFEDDSSPHGKKSEAVSASFSVGTNGLSGSVSAAQADGEKTKGYFGHYPAVAGGYYPPPVPPPVYGGYYPGGYGGIGGLGHHQSSSSSAAAASSSSGGHPSFPILGGPVSHSGSGASAGGWGGSGLGYYPGGGGYYPGSGVGYYPGQGYYPGGGVYGYPGAGGYGGPSYLAPVGVGGLYGGGPAGGYYPGVGGPGYLPPYGYGGFRKGDGDADEKHNKAGSPAENNNNEDYLNKNYNGAKVESSNNKPSTSGVIFKDN
ncbi:glycine-rich protein DOT1 isoform X2 [Folsomia candida]|uniref:glycine-rich protein DOT1 isoform X2 n=1 Tax=Folsomia candida TaxID=158441 RepID=UPI000B9011C1|nr:glycine-rich protein DOT1 isoform X2 [Folsomia candida]